MEGKRSGLGVFVIQGKRGASSQLVVNNLEQLLRTDRIYTIKWRAGGPLRCRSRSHRSGGSTIRRYVRLARRYSIRHGRRIRAIFRCVIRAFGRWNRLRLLIKWRCHDALLSLSSSITSTEEASPATVTVNPTAMASRYRSLIIASLLIARFALRYIETSVWRCYYVRKLAFCMHVSFIVDA